MDVPTVSVCSTESSGVVVCNNSDALVLKALHPIVRRSPNWFPSASSCGSPGQRGIKLGGQGGVKVHSSVFFSMQETEHEFCSYVGHSNLGVVHTFIIVLTYSIHDASVLSLDHLLPPGTLHSQAVALCLSTIWMEECIRMALVSASSLEVKK